MFKNMRNIFYKKNVLSTFLSQLFAVQLISFLAIQYPIPKSFSMCKYVVQQMTDLLCALPIAKRNQFFVPALGCLQRFCKAFPPIRSEVVTLLLQIGRVAISQLNKGKLTGKIFFLYFEHSFLSLSLFVKRLAAIRVRRCILIR